MISLPTTFLTWALHSTKSKHLIAVSSFWCFKAVFELAHTTPTLNSFLLAPNCRARTLLPSINTGYISLLPTHPSIYCGSFRHRQKNGRWDSDPSPKDQPPRLPPHKVTDKTGFTCEPLRILYPYVCTAMLFFSVEERQQGNKQN